MNDVEKLVPLAQNIKDVLEWINEHREWAFDPLYLDKFIVKLMQYKRHYLKAASIFEESAQEIQNTIDYLKENIT